MVGFHVGYCSTNENSKALKIREIIPTMQYVPHYYVHIPPIEDPQHSNNLCSQKLSIALLCSDTPIQDAQH